MYGTRYLERINRFLLFLFLLDTGGWLQVRLAVIILFLLQYLIRSNSAFKGSILLAWGFMVILMLPPLFNAFNGGVELSKSLLYIYPLLIFPMFYVIFTSIGVSSETFIGAMRYFAVFVIGCNNGKFLYHIRKRGR